MKVQITYRELSELTPYPNNPRVITEEALADLCQSIEEDLLYFETRPIICSDRTGKLVIVAGEKRYLASIRLGKDKVPVAVIPGLTEEDERRILIKDNGSFGNWDYDMLKDLHAQGWSFEFAKTWGANIDLSHFESGGKSIVSDDFEQAANLTYVHYNNYRIPVSDVEAAKLNAAIERFLEENGTLIGFINHILPDDE
ncbi:MAG: ParB N-terminal domain-containing protein [Tenuifilaceae bacterium]|jgi:hypothetical protein|nr:ParB N-terminal domain-containing protein [Tenuifilaceae bacterium]